MTAFARGVFEKLKFSILFRSVTAERTAAVLSFALPALIFCLTLNSGGGQAENIVSMQSSLLQGRSVNVSPYGMDMIQYGGKFYNVYAPGFAFLSFPFASLGFVTYRALYGYVGNAILMDELFLAICASLSGFIVYKTSQLFTKLPFASLLASLALTLGTSVWPYAVSVFPHDSSMLFSLVSVYMILRSSRAQSNSVSFCLLAGLSLGIATLVEYAAGLFVLPSILYLLIENRTRIKSVPKSTASFATAFAVVGVGLNLLYNYSIFGNLLAFPQGMSGTGLHFIVNSSLLEHIAFYLVSPFRGVFVFCPILILGAFGLREMWRWYRREFFLFISLFGAILVYYSAWQGWDGAWAYGPRFLVLGLPYLAIPISILLSGKRKWYKLYFGFFIISTFIQGIGAIAGPSAPGRNKPLLFQPLSYALPQILSGNSAVFWIQGLNYPGVIVVTIFIFSIVWYAASKVLGSAEKKFVLLEFEPKKESSIEIRD